MKFVIIQKIKYNKLVEVVAFAMPANSSTARDCQLSQGSFMTPKTIADFETKLSLITRVSE